MAINIGPRIGIDNVDGYRKEINQIIQSTKALKAEYERISTSNINPFSKVAEQSKVLTSAIEQQKERISKMAESYEEAVNKWGEDNTKTLRWKQALENARIELNKLEEQLKSLPNAVQIVGQKFEEWGGKIKSAGQSIKNVGQTLMPLSTAAAGVLVGGTKSAIDFEKAFTGVQKTVDATEPELAELEKWIKKASTEMASSKEDIAGVMEVSGQLGISGVDNLESFTKTMIMLGDTTNLSADEAATALARFMNITGTSAKDADKLGSTVVDLGNNYATTESEIVEMSTRLASAGTIAGLTETDILALATAMSSVGIQAEAGGTAMTQTLNAITKAVDGVGEGATEKLEKIASIAGMSAEEFSSAWKNEPIKAVQAFITGLGNLDESSESAVAVLDDLGMSGVRQSNMLKSLALASDTLTSAIETSNRAWSENSALENEANKRYETTAVKLQQAKERITNLAIEIGERLLPYLDKGLDFLDKLIEAWDGLSTSQQDNIVKTVAVIAAAGPLLTTIGSVVSGIGTIVTAVGGMISAAGAIGPLVAGIGSAVGAVVPAIGAAIGGIGAFLTGTLIPAIGAVVAGIGSFLVAAAPVIAVIAAIVAVGVLLYKNWDTIKEKAGELGQWISEKWEGLKQKTSEAWENMKKSVSDKVEDIKNAVHDKMDSVRSATEEKLNSMKDKFHDAFEDMKNTASEITENIKNAVSEAWENVKSKTEEIWNGIKDFVSDAWNSLKDNTSEALNNIRDSVSSAWDNIKSATSEAWDNIKNTVKDKIDAVKEATKDAFEGIASHIKEKWENIKQVTSDIWNNIKDNVLNAVDNVKNGVQDKIQSIKDKVNEVIDFIKNIPSQAWEWGKDLIHNFIDGIQSMWGNLTDMVSNVADTVKDFLGFSEPEKGPLSRFHTFAPDMMELFAKGIKDNTHLVTDQLSKSFDFGAEITTGYGYVPNATTSNSMTVGGTVINVYGAAGQDEEVLADIVSDKLNSRLLNLREAWA